MKIAVLNQPLANRGDEAAHKAFIRSLIKEMPETQIDVIFLNEKQELIDELSVEGANYINIFGNNKFLIKVEVISFVLNNIRFGRLLPLIRKFWKMLKQYDAVICAPGGICLGGFKNWNHLYQLSVAKKLKKPIYYWARSIGPFSDEDFSHSLFKKNSLKLLNYFSYISLRDSKSMKVAEELGIKADETLDSAYLEVPNGKVPEELERELTNSEYVVFVPNELTWHFHYKNISQEKIDNFYVNIINEIEKRNPNCKIVMLPQTYMSSINDCDYFKKLQKKINSNKLIVVDETCNSEVQQKIISGSKLVIGARYHSIVFAINNKIPFIALSYEHKISGMLEKLGLLQYSYSIENEKSFDVEKISFYDLLSGYEYTPAISPQEVVEANFKTMIEKINN